MAEENLTTADIEGFADKLEAFAGTLSENEQAMLTEVVSIAANVDADEVSGFQKFGIRQMAIGIPFGELKMVRPGGFGGKGGFGGMMATDGWKN